MSSMNTILRIERPNLGGRDEQAVAVFHVQATGGQTFWVRFAMDHAVAIHFWRLVPESDSGAHLRLYGQAAQGVPPPQPPPISGTTVFFHAEQQPRADEIGVFISLDELDRLARKHGEHAVPEAESFAPFLAGIQRAGLSVP